MENFNTLPASPELVTVSQQSPAPTTETLEPTVTARPFTADQPLTPDTLGSAMASARTAFASAEGRAAEAAAQAFCIWYWCCSDVAPSDLKKAYDDGVDKRNEQIKQFNDGIKKKQTAANNEFDTFEKKTKDAIEVTNDPDVVAQLNADIEAEKQQRDDKIAELRATRQVLIKKRDGTVPFVEAVKYALDLTKQTQASQVNRYAAVLGWIHKKVFDDGKLITALKPSAADIAAQIQQVNGITGAASIYKSEQVDGYETEDRSIKAAALDAKLTQALHGMLPMATAQMPLDTDKDEFVLLFAHKKGTSVELLTKLEMTSEEATKMAAARTTAQVLKGNPETEFLGETLAAASQIEKPVIYFDAERAPEKLVVTFKEMQDGAPILHAKPKQAAVQFMPTTGSVLLEENEVNQLASRLGTAYQRKLVSVGVCAAPGMTAGTVPTPSPFAWETVNTALADKNRASAVTPHKWTNTDYVEDRPHDVVDVHPNLVVSITRADFQALAQGQLKAWAEDKSAQKANNVMTLSFSATDLTVAGEKGADKVPVKMVGTLPKQSCKVTMHPKTLVEAFKMLLQTSATVFEIAPDDRGVVKLSWETDYGFYHQYLPLCRKGRKFETRLIVPTR